MREVGGRPQHYRNQHDHGARAIQKRLAAIKDAHAQRCRLRPAIGRHFENERRVFAAENCRFQQARGEDRHEESKKVETQHGRGARNRRTVRASARWGMNAAITMVYTGSRAEQVMNGAIRMVAMRSRLLSMVRVAMMAGTAQA